MKKNGFVSPVLAIFLGALIISIVVLYYIKNNPEIRLGMPLTTLPPEETSTTPTPTATTTPSSKIDINPFKDYAKTSTCSDKRNDLYVIDNSLVFLAQEGSCADAAYSYTLFGKTPDEKLCSYHDSIAGPRKTCTDETQKELFDIVSGNTDNETLGLDGSHQVFEVK